MYSRYEKYSFKCTKIYFTSSPLPPAAPDAAGDSLQHITDTRPPHYHQNCYRENGIERVSKSQAATDLMTQKQERVSVASCEGEERCALRNVFDGEQRRKTETVRLIGKNAAERERRVLEVTFGENNTDAFTVQG